MTTDTPADADLAAEYDRLPFYRRAWFCGAVLIGGMAASPLLGEAAPLFGALAAIAILWQLTTHFRQWGGARSVILVTRRQRLIGTAVCGVMILGTLAKLVAGPAEGSRDRYTALPMCDAPDVIEMVQLGVAASEEGKKEGLRILSVHDVVDYTQGGPTPPSRYCKAKAIATSTARHVGGVGYIVTWSDKARGSIEVDTQTGDGS